MLNGKMDINNNIYYRCCRVHDVVDKANEY